MLNIGMWLLSSAALLAWINGITLKRPFRTNAKYLIILLATHLALSVAAVTLKKHGVVVLHSGSSPWMRQAVGSLLKGYITLVLIIMLGFMISLASKGADQMARFHKTYNAANLQRNPVKFYLRQQPAIVLACRLFFMVAGIYMLWAIWFKLPF